MRWYLLAALVFSVAVVAACGHTPRKPSAGDRVKVVSVTPTDCENLGEITKEGGSMINPKGAMDDAAFEVRDEAGTMGATHLFISRKDMFPGGSVSVTGVAFKCTPKAEPAPAPAGEPTPAPTP